MYPFCQFSPQIHNHGDTQMVYSFLEPMLPELSQTLKSSTKVSKNAFEVLPLRIFPKQGAIPPHSFHIVTVEFLLCCNKVKALP